jgi:hypothetical protein
MCTGRVRSPGSSGLAKSQPRALDPPRHDPLGHLAVQADAREEALVGVVPRPRPHQQNVPPPHRRTGALFRRLQHGGRDRLMRRPAGDVQADRRAHQPVQGDRLNRPSRGDEVERRVHVRPDVVGEHQDSRGESLAGRSEAGSRPRVAGELDHHAAGMGRMGLHPVGQFQRQVNDAHAPSTRWPPGIGQPGHLMPVIAGSPGRLNAWTPDPFTSRGGTASQGAGGTDVNSRHIW